MVELQANPPTDVAELADTYPWFAVRTKSNYEKNSASQLAAKGYECYLPAYQARRRWSDRTVVSEFPLFPGYFFSRFDPRLRFPILTTPGVLMVLGFGNEPAPIPTWEIESIRIALASGLAVEPCPFLRAGQAVKITSGALKGVEGVLCRKKSGWRIIVSITLLNRSLSVEFDSHEISAL